MAAPGVAPAAWVSQTPPRVASGGRPALLRGSAFNGWTGTERRRRKPPGHAEGSALRSAPRKYGSEVERRHKWSAGRRACFASTRRRKVPTVTVAPFGAPLPHEGEGKGNDGGPRADQTTGPMNHACLLLETMRASAGCLTCESVMRAWLARHARSRALAAVDLIG